MDFSLPTSLWIPVLRPKWYPPFIVDEIFVSLEQLEAEVIDMEQERRNTAAEIRNINLRRIRVFAKQAEKTEVLIMIVSIENCDTELHWIYINDLRYFYDHIDMMSE